MTLNKNQRRHRKRQQESKRDYKRAKTASGYPAQHVTRRNITLRISVAAFERLQELAEYEEWTMTDMLTHLLVSQIPRYSSTVDDKHHWDDQLMDHSGLTTRRRAAKDSKKLSLWVTSTAWNKLHCHKTTLKLSKSRIVESLIMNYKPTTHEHRQRIRNKLAARQAEYAEQYAWRQANPIGFPPSAP